MKRFGCTPIVITAFIVCCFTSGPVRAEESKQALKTDKERASYSVGVDLARNMKRQGIEVEPEAFLKGMRDALTARGFLMSEEEMARTLTQFQQEERAKKLMARRDTTQNIKRMGEAFLETNRKKEGIVTLPSGLQYKILLNGEGRRPKASDWVEVNFKGMFIDGTEFDSTSGKPATLNISAGVIQGFKEALLRMPAGSKWQLFVPSELAYGERGAPPKIGPDTTLIFELELVAIK